MDPGAIPIGDVPGGNVPGGRVPGGSETVPPCPGVSAPCVSVIGAVPGVKVIGAIVLTGLTPGLTTGLTPVLFIPGVMPGLTAGLTGGCVRYSIACPTKESSWND